MKTKFLLCLILLQSVFSISQTCNEVINNAFGFNQEDAEDGKNSFSFVLADGTISSNSFGTLSTNVFPGLTPEALWVTEVNEVIRATDGNSYVRINGGSPQMINIPSGLTVIDWAADDTNYLLLASNGTLYRGLAFNPTTPIFVGGGDFVEIFGDGHSSGIFYAQRANGTVSSVLPGSSTLTPQPALTNLAEHSQAPFSTLSAGVFQDGTGGVWTRTTGTLSVTPISPPAGQIFVDVKVTSSSRYEFLTDTGNIIQYPSGTTILTGIDAISASININIAVDFDTNTVYHRSTSSDSSSGTGTSSYATLTLPPGYTVRAVRAYRSYGVLVLEENATGDIEIWSGVRPGIGSFPSISFLTNVDFNFNLMEDPTDPPVASNPCFSCVIDDPGAIAGTCTGNNNLEFTTTITASNTTSTYSVTSGGVSIATGATYGTPMTFTIPDAADGIDKTITITDDGDSSCTLDVTITGAAACFICPAGTEAPRFLGLTKSTWMTIGMVSALGTGAFVLLKKFAF